VLGLKYNSLSCYSFYSDNFFSLFRKIAETSFTHMLIVALNKQDGNLKVHSLKMGACGIPGTVLYYFLYFVRKYGLYPCSVPFLHLLQLPNQLQDSHYCYYTW
jgi:hypothetical protein